MAAFLQSVTNQMMASKSTLDWHSVQVHSVGSSEGCGEERAPCSLASEALLAATVNLD